MNPDRLDGKDLTRMIVAGTNWLNANKEVVNSLNVFPVPDGDTGTNMALTLACALREIEKVSEGHLTKVANAAALGSLMGARGNSGVIFSQLFRGFARSVEGKDSIGPLEFARALQEASDMAYKAVLKPVEGTMLTVAREAAKAAMQAAREGDNLAVLMRKALRQAEVTLDRTPEMLRTLKDAGVVDAGGKGLVLFADGALRGFHKEEVSIRDLALVSGGLTRAESTVSARFAYTKEEKLNYKYCTEFLLKGRRLPLDKLREDLSSYGDCILVVGTPEVSKIHIHTNNPGLILETCLSFGDLTDIQINNMVEQHKSFVAGAEAPLPGRGPSFINPLPDVELKPVGIVAVANGGGLVDILKSLGADTIVEGGQTMNPSTEDLVGAVESTPALSVVVLPNNANVLLAAEKVKELSSKRVLVVPTRTVPEGIAALLALRPDADPETNDRAMRDAVRRVKTGEVTYAVRDSSLNGFSIGEKDIIGLYNGELKAVGKNRPEVVRNLVGQMVTDTSELVTVYYGTDVAREEAESLVSELKGQCPHCEIELHYGGQPIYYYIFSVE